MIRILKILLLISILISTQAYGLEKGLSIYGLKKGDHLDHVIDQCFKFGLKIEEKSTVSESGKQLALYIYKESSLSLIVVLQDKKVLWIDVLEKGQKIRGMTVGDSLFKYFEKGSSIQIYGHRDSATDDIICLIDSVKVLIDSKYYKIIMDYRKNKDAQVLKKLFIKGFEI